MKLRLAFKIWNGGYHDREYNKFMFDKSRTRVIKYFKAYKTPKWVWSKRELKYKDKILTSNNILSEGLREYINNKQLKRKKHGRR